MAEPKAIGTVLAMLVGPEGQPLKGGSARGQLYVSPQSVMVVRPEPWEGAIHALTIAFLVGSVAVAFADIALWRSVKVIWVALAMQMVYWLSLPYRRRMLAPRPLGAAALDDLRRDGRAAIFVPGDKVKSVSAPGTAAETGRTRRPARLELPEGALELYLTADAFDEVRAALGRT